MVPINSLDRVVLRSVDRARTPDVLCPTVAGLSQMRQGDSISTPNRAGVRQRALRARLVDLILQRGLRPGDPIPTEGELMALLDVGRNTLRETLKALQAQGVVDVRHGYGMYVGSGDLDSLVDGLSFRGRMSLRHDGHEARELVQVREALESSLIVQVIHLITEPELEAVRGTVEQMEARAERGGRFADLDGRFHRQLFAPLGNALLTELLAAFWIVYQQLSEDIGEAVVDPREVAANHRSILEAVLARDPQRAAAAMQHHFVGIHIRLGGAE